MSACYYRDDGHQAGRPRLSVPSSLIADGSRRSLQINDVVTFRPVESQLTPDLRRLHRNRLAAWSGTLQPSHLAMPIMCHVDMNGDQSLHSTFHVHIPRNGRRRFVYSSSSMESPLLCPDTGTTTAPLARYDCCDVAFRGMLCQGLPVAVGIEGRKMNLHREKKAT